MADQVACKAKDCSREAFAKHYCRKHYRLWRRGEMPKPRYKRCTAEKCTKKRFRGSLCEEHWKTMRAGAKAAEGGGAAPAAPAAEGGAAKAAG